MGENIVPDPIRFIYLNVISLTKNTWKGEYSATVNSLIFGILVALDSFLQIHKTKDFSLCMAYTCLWESPPVCTLVSRSFVQYDTKGLLIYDSFYLLWLYMC